jgi:guanosine-3',5'-bis(diphosphate) 3'-pyrophosphohydrolase
VAEALYDVQHLYQTLEPSLGYLSPPDQQRVREALEFAHQAHQDQLRKSGEPYITHPVAVAQILAELRLDVDTVMAGLLHDTIEDTEVTGERLEQLFGPAVRRIVEGETKVSKLSKFAHAQAPAEDRRAEDLRQMFIAMAEDVRIIIVKLADRLHNMRTLEAMPPHKQQRIARETLEIYAPLAHRLGIGQVKWELEDLSFRYLHPQDYQELTARLKSHRAEREEMVRKAQEALEEVLGRDLIFADSVASFEITGRTKHFYSIWKKMERDDKAIEQIYDLLALRIILDPHPSPTPAQKALREKQVCYHLLGVVHALWQPIPGRVKDYIAVPKPNGYQSLHTTVIAVNGLPLEVQIRTREMHNIAEYGVAAHWLYKQGLTDPEELKRRTAWLKSIQDWQQEFTNSREFVDAVTTDLLGDRVFVFTPRGKIINLVRGSTPVDFAYHIHTEIGHHMVGAKINNRIVPLSHPLQNGDIVEILTAKTARPSKDWEGFARTSSAKAKIRGFFRTTERQELLDKGQGLLERYFKRRSLPKPLERQLEEASRKLLRHPSTADLYLALAQERISAQQVARTLNPPSPATPTAKVRPVRNELGIRLESNLAAPLKLASCCNPEKGDPILAYVTRGRGVTIHKADCQNLRRLLDQDAGRVVMAYWEGVGWGRVLSLEIVAADRAGLMRDVMDVVASAGKSAMGIESRILGPYAHMKVRLECSEGEQQTLESRIRALGDVHELRWAES